MQRLVLQGVVWVLLVCVVPSLLAATLETPAAGLMFKSQERVACSGSCGAADGVIAIAVKNKKGVTYKSVVKPVAGDNWTVVLDPPKGGWPLGEMTVEIFSGTEGQKQASAKIVFTK